MMILVTGGTGTTGYFIICALQQRGLAVRALVRPSSVEKLKDLDVDIAFGDLADTESLRRAADGVQGIIHAACTFTDALIDQAAMVTLIDAWENGPFVFISSVDVYGTPQYLPLDERHPLNSTDTDYGKSKVQCEMLLQNAAKSNGRADWSILRPPHIWGPHPSCANKIKRQYKAIWMGETVLLAKPVSDEPELGDGWVDARELGWAAAECLDHPLNGAANIVNDHFTWEALYQELIDLTGSQSNLELSATVSGIYATDWQYDGQYLIDQLGFQPQYQWQGTLAEVINPQPENT